MDNPYSPPDLLQEKMPERISRFSIREASALGWQRYKDHFMVATGVAVVWTLLMVLATNSCIGLVVLPHLAAGWAIAGIGIARNKPRFEAMFNSFESFGPVFAAGGLFTLIYSVGFLFVCFIFFSMIFLLSFWSEALNWKALARLTETEGSNSPFEYFLFLVFGLGFTAQAFLGARFQLAFNLVMERKLPALEAFKESWRITRPHTVPLGTFRLIFDLILPAVGIASCCLPGILFAMPLSLAMRGAASNMLLGDTGPDSTEAFSSSPIHSIATATGQAGAEVTLTPQDTPTPPMRKPDDPSHPYN
ncbi:MAG: hypothetical protein K8S54_18765 [Spirochaetia bacterium]|nr:hypothetical protein [Spirochaetia bacterium]